MTTIFIIPFMVIQVNHCNDFVMFDDLFEKLDLISQGITCCSIKCRCIYEYIMSKQYTQIESKELLIWCHFHK